MEKKMEKCWLNYKNVAKHKLSNCLKNVVYDKRIEDEFIISTIEEIRQIEGYNECKAEGKIEWIVSDKIEKERYIIVVKSINEDVFENKIIITAGSTKAILYAVFSMLRNMECGKYIQEDSKPVYSIRMINHWDNIDGTVERGYAGSSIFFQGKKFGYLSKQLMEEIGIPNNQSLIREAIPDEYELAQDTENIKLYARLLCSVGINSIVVNNTNVHKEETLFLTKKAYIIEKISEIMSKYGIKVYISINFAAPITLGELETADPKDEKVIKWWGKKVDNLYKQVPKLGGFMVKADSEGREGPFTYGRNHDDGANMLARALKPHGGILIWRCFVYNCRQDWRDRKIDRAKAAYDCFKPLDGNFDENVYLQIKNGPIDFQVREPNSPLFYALKNTNKLLEIQLTQEYTGQQKHVCYLVPSWKETLDKDVRENICGIAGVANVGNDNNFTGHYLAQANLYGYGRLLWNTELESKQIALEWIKMTLGNNESVIENVIDILMSSWYVYESYTAPLGVGFMVNPGNHYGANPLGYEYDRWGTYHFADHYGVGVDRTKKTGTGFTKQYKDEIFKMYEDVKTCPDEVLLFFHHVSYMHILHSGETVIQHIYNTHFDGCKKVREFIEKWENIKDNIDDKIYKSVLERLYEQYNSSIEWRDKINSFFYRMSGIDDEKNRKLY